MKDLRHVFYSEGLWPWDRPLVQCLWKIGNNVILL